MKCSMAIRLIKVTNGYQSQFGDRFLWQGSVNYPF